MKTELYSRIPDTPGVYLMKDAKGEILYVGKAANLKRRVSSYFTRPPAFAKAASFAEIATKAESAGKHDYRIQKMVSLVKKVDYRKTDTALEALILEAELIKKYQPAWNVLEKDDKSFLYVEFTKEKFPRVLLVRGKSLAIGRRFGPFVYGGSIREALRILRKIFPYSIHSVPQEFISHHSHIFVTSHRLNRPCFDYQIGLCPGTCVGAITVQEYRKNIRNLIIIFEGKKKRVLKSLEKDMKWASKSLEFEKAGILRRQIFGLKHIQDVALIREGEIATGDPSISLRAYKGQRMRIEGYDISNISGTSAVGSMVVFQGDEPEKSEYRKFKIRTIHQSDDVGMLREVLRRRFAPRHLNGGWRMPHLILIDGGLGQVNAARQVLLEARLKIPIVGIAKGSTRKKNEFVAAQNVWASLAPLERGAIEPILIKVRDEAHRFAIAYHRTLRGRETLK